ncbi:hypothetical protein LOZ53_003423 [Ophidiomyces ophidiicola]|nr:hypothetical protein LOZ55_003145 [Ophidiomyces ophidiicola]KAI1982680.1 hypothetical protein LOZ54_005324 [Ophidiomyces ophidiicola]KAI1987075.1 hypothetical protein LOZ51_005848 [Ophidiomyces ophidiicola]KAI1989955.1 hypothetical protein LOZ53_003423 [Ophidiomyces ophidiicola]
MSSLPTTMITMAYTTANATAAMVTDTVPTRPPFTHPIHEAPTTGKTVNTSIILVVCATFVIIFTLIGSVTALKGNFRRASARARPASPAETGSLRRFARRPSLRRNRPYSPADSLSSVSSTDTTDTLIELTVPSQAVARP